MIKHPQFNTPRTTGKEIAIILKIEVGMLDMLTKMIKFDEFKIFLFHTVNIILN